MSALKVKPGHGTGNYILVDEMGFTIGEVQKKVERFNIAPKAVTSISWVAYFRGTKIDCFHRTRRSAVEDVQTYFDKEQMPQEVAEPSITLSEIHQTFNDRGLYVARGLTPRETIEAVIDLLRANQYLSQHEGESLP